MNRLFRKRPHNILVKIGPHRTHSPPTDIAPPLDDSIYENTWIIEFDLTNPRDLKLARLIVKMCMMSGHTFELYLLDKKVAEFDHFPEFNEVYHCVVKQFHGGVFSVKHSSKPNLVLKTYSIEYSPPPPPPKDQDKPEPDRFFAETEAALMQEGMRMIMESSDPEVKNQFGRALIEKKLGIRLPRPDDVPLREKVLAEAMENPEFSQRYAERLLDEAILGQPPAAVNDQTDPLENFMEGAEQFKKVMDDMGYNLDANRSVDSEAWSMVIKEFVANGGVGQLLEGLAEVMAKRKNVTETGQMYPADVYQNMADMSPEGTSKASATRSPTTSFDNTRQPSIHPAVHGPVEAPDGQIEAMAQDKSQPVSTDPEGGVADGPII